MARPISLADAQLQMARTIAQGPEALTDALFAGTPAQVIRGLKVHANTISHARLVALEATFPRTRALIGEAIFNTLSRNFLDTGNGRNQSLDGLGRHFADWLQANAIAPECVTLARFEWLWLESYHAADVTPLSVSAFAALSQTEVLELRIKPHPAARVLRNDANVATIIGLDTTDEWLLLARPDAEVLAYAIPDTTASLLRLFAESDNLAHAFETFLSRRSNNNPLAAMQFLLAAEVLRKDESQC